MDDRIKERVNIWLAKDENGNLVNILEAEQGKDYYCLECGEILRARAKESEKVTPHFYHLNNSNCGGGINESEIHKYFKANLFHEGDTFIVGGREYLVLQVELEHLFLNEFGTTKDYKPDITLKVENKRTGKISTICIELYYTNAKDKDEYYDRWKFFAERKDFKAVFEIDLNKLEFDSNCKKAMETAEMLFPSKDYEIYRRISKNEKKVNKEYNYEIRNLKTELTSKEGRYKKELKDIEESIRKRKSYYKKEFNEEIEKEYETEVEKINRERQLKLEEAKRKYEAEVERINREGNLKVEELKERDNPRIRKAREEYNSKVKKMEEEEKGNRIDIEVEYKSITDNLKQRIEELENKKNENNEKFVKELLAKYSKEEIKKALKKYEKNN